VHVARLRPVKWHFAAQELVEENAEPVHDAPLGGRKSGELLRRNISRITFRRLRRRELLGEAELPENQHVRPEELHAVGIVHDDVRRSQG
jgi:hypothetical protein